jgi:hypothetical protein
VHVEAAGPPGQNNTQGMKLNCRTAGKKRDTREKQTSRQTDIQTQTHKRANVQTGKLTDVAKPSTRMGNSIKLTQYKLNGKDKGNYRKSDTRSRVSCSRSQKKSEYRRSTIMLSDLKYCGTFRFVCTTDDRTRKHSDPQKVTHRR